MTASPEAADNDTGDAGAGLPRLVNLTPHPIRLLRLDGTPACELPAPVEPARCTEHTRPHGTLPLADGTALPLVRVGFGPVTGLPQPAPGTWYVVSRLVAEASPHRDDLLVPHQVVRDAQGAVTGCHALARGAATHHTQAESS